MIRRKEGVLDIKVDWILIESMQWYKSLLRFRVFYQVDQRGRILPGQIQTLYISVNTTSPVSSLHFVTPYFFSKQ